MNEPQGPMVTIANEEEDQKVLAWTNGKKDRERKQIGRIVLGSKLDRSQAEATRDLPDPRARIPSPEVQMTVAQFRQALACPVAGKPLREWLKGRQVRVIRGPGDILNEFAA